MQLKQHADNGNVALRKPEIESHLNYDNRSWILDNTTYFIDNRTNNTQLNSINCNSRADSDNIETESDLIHNDDSGNLILNDDFGNLILNDEAGNLIRNEANSIRNEVSVNLLHKDGAGNLKVCNQQYRLDNERKGLLNIHPKDTQAGNLEGTVALQLTVPDTFLGDTDGPLSPSPSAEERAFDHSDTDDMSEISHPVDPVPRGIVNPNYPGFQHFAHTLQNYSTNIDNFDQSENEMTDDDVDIADILENNNETNINNNEIIETTINNNNIDENVLNPDENLSKPLDIPDLLKTVSYNNNNHVFSHEIQTVYSETDVDNNFDTTDIIGNFNKEIEDEIKQLLNYNINIQSDLDELRQDIKDNLAEPIQNTINNISDVVNHVIKKLVEIETQGDVFGIDIKAKRTENEDIIEENETNARKEMNQLNISRPTFLCLESNNDVIPDAVLSDGTEEINIDEDCYNAETLSDKSEKTIQKLGAQLRNVIPKLDDKHQDKSCNIQQSETFPDVVITDGNSNEIASTSFTRSVELSPSLYIEPSDLKVNENTSCSKNQVVSKASLNTKSNKSDQSKNDAAKNLRHDSPKTSVHLTESSQNIDLESFDVYNIETALPKLDFDAIESHLKAAKEAERRKHNDREEIRRRLAAGVDNDEFHSLGHGDRPGRKPSLHSRLQSGRNLQICYMNETASDNESQLSDIDKNVTSSNSLSRSSIFSKSDFNHPYQTRPLSVNISKQEKLGTTQSAVKLRAPLISRSKSRSSQSLSHMEVRESDFRALQATLQTEARVALAQAKETARVQMERERRARGVCPVSRMMRHSMERAGAPLAADRRRVSRQLLTDMNIAQLQVIVNAVHSHIESLNETLVRLLMERDELHMGQDSMLVDIEDLTRYLGVKEQTKKTKGTKSGVRRLTSFIQK